MAYEVHITRKANWFDNEGEIISLEEWRNFAAKDKDLRLDALPDQMGDQSTIRLESPGAAQWLGHSNKSVKPIWLRHFRDRVTAKDPDTETLVKMHRIATALKGRVQGNDGEIYAADGSSSRKPKAAPAKPQAATAAQPEEGDQTGKRSWWKFGK